MLAKLFTLVHVGQVHFDKRDSHRQQRIAQRHTRVRERRRIENDEIDAFTAGIMDAADQFVAR